MSNTYLYLFVPNIQRLVEGRQYSSRKRNEVERRGEDEDLYCEIRISGPLNQLGFFVCSRGGEEKTRDDDVID